MSANGFSRFIAAVLGLLAAADVVAVPDPTRPPTPEEIRAWRGGDRTSAPHWRLESVLISKERRVAVINGRSVGVGDRVDGARVLAIERGRVTLRTDGSRVDLSLRRQADRTNIRQDASR